MANDEMRPRRGSPGTRPLDRLKVVGDLLLRSYQEARTSFENDRAQEWKLRFAIWTVLAAFVAFALRGEVRLLRHGLYLLAAVGFVVFAFEAIWEFRVVKWNIYNQERIRRVETEINGLWQAARNSSERPEDGDRPPLLSPTILSGRLAEAAHICLTAIILGAGMCSALCIADAVDETPQSPPPLRSAVLVSTLEEASQRGDADFIAANMPRLERLIEGCREWKVKIAELEQRARLVRDRYELSPAKPEGTPSHTGVQEQP